MKRLVLAVISIFLIQSSFAQWAAMGTSMSGTVNALCVHNDTLFAAGVASGAAFVKKWTPSTNSWYTVGSLNGTNARALISFNGSLYVGGAFTMAGNKNNVARLSGATWVTVGDGLGGIVGSSVNCFYIWSDTLCAGGSFSASGVNPTNRVAKLDLGIWKQLGPDVPPHVSGSVNAITSYNNELYVGGQGSSPNMDKLVGNVWNTSWYSGGGSPDFWVNALDVFPFGSQGPTLFIGGTFSSKLMTYSSSGFGSSFNTFTGSGVNALVHSSNNIFAGGTFSVQSNSNVAKKTISGPWVAAQPSNTLGSDVKAFCFYKGYLIAGGSFTTPFNSVARTATPVGVEEISSNIIINTLYPNPIISEALLKVQTKAELKQPELRMLDVNGNELLARTTLSIFNHAKNEVEFKIDREGLMAGIYFYMVTDEDRTVATGKFIVE